MSYAVRTRADQPVNRIEWINRADIDPNDYNPNHVAPPEMRLLKRSILSEGWLFPLLVCLPAPDDRTTNRLLTASADTSVNEEDEGKAP